ncbi:MAG: HNH endonuclease signature motif containing protein [Ignavibacteriaceae bacterium]|nr:HNH endonuclease signature motif containing protein [Ignavibacteriaceae bacterium]
MPPKYVKTIQEEIYYEYAKLISRSAFNGNLQYGFITNKFKELRDGRITISGTIREWQREHELPQLCVFCGSTVQLQTDHLIPKARGGSDSADNLVQSCKQCNTSRNDRGVFEWLGLKEKDKLHRLVAGKYLKELYDLHLAKGTLNTPLEELTKLCVDCRNPKTCEEWDKVGELTCFCLESIF